jgi:hypothetical protein
LRNATVWRERHRILFVDAYLVAGGNQHLDARVLVGGDQMQALVEDDVWLKRQFCGQFREGDRGDYFLDDPALEPGNPLGMLHHDFAGKRRELEDPGRPRCSLTNSEQGTGAGL